MNKYNVWVYAICKNEEKFVDAWMDSMTEADGVLVIDTGSTDDSVKRLRDRGAVVVEETFTPWRFDAARNKALDLLGPDVDICVSTDLDEILLPGWRRLLEEQWQEGTTRGHFLYNFKLDENDQPLIQYNREKIHTRHDYRWFAPVHERLEYTGPEKENGLFLQGVVLNHYPDVAKPRGQYLPLLELTVEENPHDDRAMFWLGREYTYNAKHKEAIKTLERHLALPTATWEEERCASMRLIADSYQAQGYQKEARNWYYKAIAECPGIREPYCDFALFGYRTSNWPLVFAMGLQGLKITSKTGSYLVEEKSWGPFLHDLVSIAAFQMGMFPQALEQARKALALNPLDERLQGNVARIESKVKGD